MLPLYIFALLIHAAFSSTPCQDGVEIVSKESRNPEDLIGNWTFAYHWDDKNDFPYEFDEKADHSDTCPEIQFAPVAPEFVKAREAECVKSKLPFNWSDIKLRVDAPLMSIKGGLIAIGEKESWLMVDCKKMVRFITKRVSDDYVAMINPDVSHISELITRNQPTLEELKCIAHNADVGKGLKGLGICYKK